jgi:hypothetical protein
LMVTGIPCVVVGDSSDSIKGEFPFSSIASPHPATGKNRNTTTKHWRTICGK